jgi:hypothetical protein
VLQLPDWLREVVVEDGERLPQVVLPQRVKIRIDINIGALQASAFPRVVAKLESLRVDCLWLSEQLSTLRAD